MQVCFINNLQGKKMKIYARVFPHTFPIHRKITPIISKSTPKKIEYTLNPNTAIDIQKPLRPATYTHTPYIYVKHFCNGGARGGTLIVTPDHAEFQFIAQVYHKLWLLRQHRSLRPFLRPRSKSELPLLSISADVRV